MDAGEAALQEYWDFQAERGIEPRPCDGELILRIIHAFSRRMARGIEERARLNLVGLDDTDTRH